LFLVALAIPDLLCRSLVYNGVRAPLIDRRPDVAATRPRLDRLARVFDSAFSIPVFSVRFGKDAALNLIPGIGTLAAKGISSYIIIDARRTGVATSTLPRMCTNIGIDFEISAILVIGWFGDVIYRANQKNIALLKARLDRRSGVIDGAFVQAK
jgi:hypothetical protein